MSKKSTADSLKPTGKTATRNRQPQPKTNARNNADAQASKVAPFKLDQQGVHWFDPKLERWRWLCGWLDVVAVARTQQGNDWGALVRFRDRDNVEREWNIPYELFGTDGGTEVIKRLLGMGLNISSERFARRPLIEYLMGTETEKRVTLTNKMGWHGSAFMLADQVIGDALEPLHFYADAPASLKAQRTGTLEEWREQIAAYACGNDLLTFAISAAFVAPLLDIVGAETCGFHFVGDSSLGKSTLLRLAASVCGSPSEYPRTWRATDNALEATAAAHSDCLLILDEIGQCDPRLIGEIVYMLGNGQGKARATDRGGVREIQHRWRLQFLSSGERTLLDHMGDAGKKPQAGMEMRLLTVPACLHSSEAERKHKGIYQNLHSFAGGAGLSDHLNSKAAEHHGVAFPAFLEQLVKRDRNQLAKQIITAQSHFTHSVLTEAASGQAHRAADKFALVAIAGELATEWGLTGWKDGAATLAAGACFHAWLDKRGGEGSHEERQMLEQVRSLLATYGESRFTRWDRQDSSTDTHAPRTQERWGFSRTVEANSMLDGKTTEAHFYVLPDNFRQHLAKGYDSQRVARLLADRGALMCEGERLTKRVRLPGMGDKQVRCYVILASALHEDSDASDKQAA